MSSYITNNMDIGTPSLAAVVTAGDELKIAQDLTADPNILRSAKAGGCAPRGSKGTR